MARQASRYDDAVSPLESLIPPNSKLQRAGLRDHSPYAVPGTVSKARSLAPDPDDFVLFSRAVEQRLDREGFSTLSPFAERFGAWEMRLVRTRGDIVSMISIASLLEQKERMLFEVNVGTSFEREQDHRSRGYSLLRVGKFLLKVPSVNTIPPSMERVLAEAASVSDGLERKLLADEEKSKPAQSEPALA